MDNDTQMLRIVKTMLLEGELKDIFSTITAGNHIYIILQGGGKRIYQVESNGSGRIIMKDKAPKSNGMSYIMTRESLNGNKLTIYQYDGKAATKDFKGQEFQMEIDSMNTINDKTGTKENIDVEGNEDDVRNKENVGRIDQYNELMKKLDTGDVLRITTESQPSKEGEDTIVNDLFFEVVDVRKSWYVFTLKDIHGDAEGTEAKASLNLANIIGEQSFYIGKEGFFKVNEGSVEIEIRYGKNESSTIKGIIDVDINNIDKGEDYDEDEKGYSKEELESWLKNQDLFDDLVNKKPNFLRTLAGASPKGLYQLKKMIQQSKVDNSYMSKGDKVKIKLLSSDLRIPNDLTKSILNKKGATYKADVVGDNKLKVGVIGRGHWEIKLIEEVEQSTYTAEVIYCDTDRVCKLMAKKATIKIIDNG